MSRKLTTKAPLSMENVPAPKADKIGIMEKPAYVTKSFRLTAETVDILETLMRRFSTEAGIGIAMGKVVEIAVWQIRDAELKSLMK